MSRARRTRWRRARVRSARAAASSSTRTRTGARRSRATSSTRPRWDVWYDKKPVQSRHRHSAGDDRLRLRQCDAQQSEAAHAVELQRECRARTHLQLQGAGALPGPRRGVQSVESRAMGRGDIRHHVDDVRTREHPGEYAASYADRPQADVLASRGRLQPTAG